MKVDVSQFHQAFFEETAEHLAAMEHLLVTLDLDNPDAESLNSIFRAAHSIKGGAGIFGFTDLIGVTHILESLLDKIRSGLLPLKPAMVDTFLAARDLLGRLLERHRSGALPDEQNTLDAARICTELEALTQTSQPAPKPTKKSNSRKEKTAKKESISADNDEGFGFFTENMPPAEDEGFGFFDPIDTTAQPADEGFGFFDALPPEKTETTIEAVAAISESRTPTAPTKTASSALDSGSIRVSVEKADQLINLVGELVITQAMLAELTGKLDIAIHENLHAAISQLERNTRELQEAAMSMRMLPIGSVFSRFPRVVRDTSAKIGKQVELILEGEATELDKGLIEKLSDPLTHLVRNAIDHGIELPDVRSANGKSTRGTVTLKAFHQGGNVVIEISDDGAGLNRDKILRKAKERGFSVSDEMSDTDVWQLIFEPGFSTADAVTDISGRGVGMDVVRRNITAMNGRIEIESFANAGSRFTIWLPLTLAILDGMLLAVDGETYVVPLTNIVESVQPEADSINTVASQGRVIRVRGEYIPLSSLRTLLGIETKIESTGIVLLLEAEGKKFALEVDELIGQNQVVIKSLENNYKRVQGFAGATILGNGRVAMILDVEALRRMSQHSH